VCNRFNWRALIKANTPQFSEVSWRPCFTLQCGADGPFCVIKPTQGFAGKAKVCTLFDTHTFLSAICIAATFIFWLIQ